MIDIIIKMKSLKKYSKMPTILPASNILALALADTSKALEEAYVEKIINPQIHSELTKIAEEKNCSASKAFNEIQKLEGNYLVDALTYIEAKPGLWMSNSNRIQKEVWLEAENIVETLIKENILRTEVIYYYNSLGDAVVEGHIVRNSEMMMMTLLGGEYSLELEGSEYQARAEQVRALRSHFASATMGIII